MDAISALVMRSKPMSGRRLIAWGLPIALAGGVLIIVLFAKYGRGNFTSAARIVEARGRAYELAAGLARCTNHGEGRVLPPSAGPVPPSGRASLDQAASERRFAAEAFVCATFHPRGQVHVEVEWHRLTPSRGRALARLDDDADGQADFEAESVVECEPQGAERCRALAVAERSFDGK